MNHRADDCTHFTSDLIAGAKDANANAVKLSGAAASSAVAVEAVGDDTNISLTLAAKGTGAVTSATGLRSTSATITSGYNTGAGGAITQLVDASTTVVLSKPCGQITTVALTTAGGSEEEFTVTNTLVAATDVIALSTTYAGQGTPMLSVKGVTAGSFKIVITNVSASALNAVMVINFAVIKAVAA